jgi:L-lactate dehydrogenase complex protein LldF
MNTCPVYRRSGGYSYAYTVPGPIGSILGPTRDPARFASLPFASSLCGSCSDICPVRIDLHHQLLSLRQEMARRRLLPWTKRLGMKAAARVLAEPSLYRFSGFLARRILPALPRAFVYAGWNVWGRQRELPPLPRESFRTLYRRRRGQP